MGQRQPEREEAWHGTGGWQDDLEDETLWVTEAQKYIQSLGFGTVRPPINMEPQDVRINQWGQDNSCSWKKHDVMPFGKGSGRCRGCRRDPPRVRPFHAADTIILQSMFDFPSDVTMPQAAQIMVQTAMVLYGADAVAVVWDSFAARGILLP